MDIVLEILFEIILDGSLELIGTKKVPLLIRILAALVLLVVYGGLFVLGIQLLVSGIQKKEWILCIVSAIILLIVVGFGVMIVRKYRSDAASE